MAEVAGVALAVPAVIEALIKGGADIYTRIDEARKIDETLGRYRQLGLDLHSRDGFLFAHLDALRTASRNSAIPRILQDQLDNLLKCCKESQDAAIEELGKYDVDRARSKWRFGIWGHSSMKKKFDKFRSDLDELDKLCLRMSFVQQTSSNLLRSEYFKLVYESVDYQPGGLLPLSDIWVAVGNYEEQGQRHQGDFVLEKKFSEVDITTLCNIIRHASPSTGVLPCLGYRQPLYNDTSPPYRSFLQLVMELPSNTTSQSLAHKLYAESAPPLSNRLTLAKLLIQAVINVHSMDLVHKSIRSRAILLTTSTNSNTPQLYLQDWTYVRRQIAATSQNGTTSAWQRSIYEHPALQLSHDHFLETAYEPTHDIYSLGVVLMEIFLWMPFVQPLNPDSEELRIANIFEEVALAMGEDIIPQRYKGNSQKLTRCPSVVRDVWIAIAKKDVSAVNEDVARIIVGCLEETYASANEVLQALEKANV